MPRKGLVEQIINLRCITGVAPGFFMINKMVSLGKISEDGDTWEIGAIISPIGELTIIKTCLAKGKQERFAIDAVSAVNLNDAQNAFYRGEFETEMNG